MYAIPAVLVLLVLIALVYLPKIRRPALWVLISSLGLGVLGLGAWWAMATWDDRKAARELSYLVDHVLGTPPHCKSKPFPGGPAMGLTDAQVDMLTRGKGTDFERAIAAGGVTVYERDLAAGGRPVQSDYERDLVAGGKPVQTDYERDLAAGWKPGAPIDMGPDARRGTAGGMRPAPRGFGPPEPREGAIPLDPDADLCKGEVGALGDLIKRNSYDLNKFIQKNQDDPRVEAVQGALMIHGLAWKKTCKNLRDEKRDNYELHAQGCL